MNIDQLSRDTLFYLALMLDLPDLLSFCKSSKRINELICKKKDIWYRKLSDNYPDHMNVDNPREYYEKLWLKEKLKYNETVEELFSNTFLTLNYRDLTEIPKEISWLKQLKYLDLSNNNLSQLPEEMSQLTNLNELYLSNNQFKEIPSVVFKLDKLDGLYLSGNQITEVPQDLEKLKNLRSFRISNNNLTEIPKVLWDLLKLKHVSLEYNKITNKPDNIDILQRRLTSFNLRGNHP